MDAKNRYFTSNKNPKIYAYSIPTLEGFIKVGYTTRDDVKIRIEEQVANILMPNKQDTYKLLLEESAEYNTKLGFYFDDKTVHSALEKKGFHSYIVDRKKSEWFKCSLDDIKEVILEIKENKKIPKGRTLSYSPRPEQIDAIKKTAIYFNAHKKINNGKAPHFLWNAKMRFGKTFTAYKLAQFMNWRKILILTYKPSVQTAWETDLNNHIDFEGWVFKNPEDIKKFNLTKEEIDGANPIVCFSSFQDILGDEGKKEKFKLFYETDWDCVILDEYHFGSWRDSAKEVYDKKELDELENDEKIAADFEDDTSLKINNYLYLSGTPFRSLSTGEFTEDQIYNWTYSNEQKAKENWSKKNKNQQNNPYADLPEIIMMTYKIPSALREKIILGETEDLNEFDLNEFFRAEGRGENSTFIYKDYVSKWLEMMMGRDFIYEINALKEKTKKRPPLPFSNTELLNYLNHTLWFLPDVASCFAMNNLMREFNFFDKYKIVVAAGNKAGVGTKALRPVEEAIYGTNGEDDPKKSKTITLTCQKLTTGISVPPWTGIFMLKNLKQPESYFQAAFRVQTPWTIKNPINGSKEVLKEKCYIFDFAPNRALKLIVDYCSNLDYESKLEPEKKVQEFLEFLPVLAFDGFDMQNLDARQLLDFVIAGTSSTMLAKKFQSPQLVNLNNFALERLLANPKLLEDLNKIEAFRNLNKNNKLEAIISNEKSLKNKKKKGEEITQEEKKEKEKNDSVKKQLRNLLLKFITRLPVFMYLTDEREKSVKEVITQVETSLFTKTTGITLETFNELCKIEIFNIQSLNAAIFAFKQYEESSLTYIGNSKHNSNIVGGWDNQYTKEEAEELIKTQSNFN